MKIKLHPELTSDRIDYDTRKIKTPVCYLYGWTDESIPHDREINNTDRSDLWIFDRVTTCEIINTCIPHLTFYP